MTEPGGTGGESGMTGGAGTTDESYCLCGPVDQSFRCTASLDHVARLTDVSRICDRPDAVTSRALCDDGSILYRWLEGGENEYWVQVDRSGNPLFFSASGYIDPPCAFDPGDNDYGTVEAGQQPESECFARHAAADACAPCDNNEELDRCVDCGWSESGETATLSLADYCSVEFCPVSIADARVRLTQDCSVEPRPSVRTGCGVVIVERTTASTSAEYVFNQATGALIGVVQTDSGPFGACFVPTYEAGNVTAADCSQVSSCEFCTSEEGHAGAGAADVACPPL